MDSRITQITTLKDALTSRNSRVNTIPTEPTPQLPSPQDVQYRLIRKQIVSTPFFNNTSKHLRIRLQHWLTYLDKVNKNKIWISTRNKYVKLLNLMCYCEILVQPFHALPPQGELPNLRKHELNQIINEVENRIKNPKSHLKRHSQHTLTNETQNGQTICLSPIATDRNLKKNYSSNSGFQEEWLQHKVLKEIDSNIPPEKSDNKEASSQKKATMQKKQGSKYFTSQNSRTKAMNRPPLRSNKPAPLEGYWESRCSEDTHTPKYLNNINIEEEKEDEVVIVSFRGKEEDCFCSGSTGESWWSNFIKMMS